MVAPGTWFLDDGVVEVAAGPSSWSKTGLKAIEAADVYCWSDG
jgi:hypothetical protein